MTSDSMRVQQILLNLLNNAIKFTETGTIRINCFSVSNFVKIQIIDSGIGIESEKIEQLFKPFMQIDTGLTRKKEGTGLGLSICKKLTEMLNGKIEVESKFGFRKHFYCYSYLLLILNLMKQKILIIEDNEQNMYMLTYLLESNNYKVFQSFSGTEGITLSNKIQPDVILLDIQLPEMDGFEATKRIKELRPDLPVIAQTAYVCDVDKTKALSCGCIDFLIKPFKKEELLTLIKEYLIL